MAEGGFNTIAIFDAIPTGEANTARRLREQLEDVSLYVVEGLSVRYFRINNYDALESAFNQLLYEIDRYGSIPWIHFEGHGSPEETGIQLADNTYCSWLALKRLISPLNIKTNLNVVLILAACYGGSFARAINPIERAPVLALIGPRREATAGEIQDSLSAFYQSYFETQSLKGAVDALNAAVSEDLYYLTSAERFFYNVWVRYKVEQCTGQAFESRVRAIHRRLKKTELRRVPGIGAIKRMFYKKEREQFEKYRDTYFMYDLQWENRSRFPVTYENAEDFVSRFMPSKS